ncbi:Hpt domain-containing protein [Rugamonas rubra]|uniref:Chemotaxis protein CheA n=1 Tax=Rugamonas rubra TaxID=758825 RepID=A0A1I4HXF9_9BURK|nr:Hpt domain-containing protein [Rugamonas rubra]SFL46849.1 Chemotaxis protein histidine kinase CheA [Rugamonas rubra]
MKTDVPNPAQAQFDTGPLSWVMVEIREALARSRTALFEAGGRAEEDQATQLQHAKSHLHQAHGALQMVDVDGAALLTAAAEHALGRFKDGSLKCSADHVHVVAQLYQALVEYVEELLDGAAPQPARLFPYYRAALEMLGAERIHPADLFFPDLSAAASAALAPAAAAGVAAGVADYAAWRQRFEKALLPYLKSTDAAQQREHAAALRDAVALVAGAQREPAARAFWLAQQGFAELVAAGRVAGGLYVKQLFGLINLQIRRLSQGSAAQPEGMLRDALFFVAAADPATEDDSATATATAAAPVARQLRRAFALDGLLPADYEARRYGQIDQQALAGARAGMAQAKASWDGQAEAPVDPAQGAAFDAALRQSAQHCDTLGLAALSTLLRQLADVAARAVSAGRGEELALEMATALLFAEHGLEQIRHLPDDFSAHADTIGARLLALVAGETPPQPAQWQGGLAQRMRQDDTVAALSAEMKNGLRQVEKVLDEYHVDAATRPALGALDPTLHQLHGALAMLDQDEAMRAVLQLREAVRQLAEGRGEAAQQARALDEIAQNVGALGFFVDMLAQNAAGARERFAFDAERGTFRSLPFKKIAAAGAVPLLDEAMPAAPPPAGPQVAPPAPASDAAVEAELLDIFINEAREVLLFVDRTLAQPRQLAGGVDNLSMLRRSFHTLKGSGRMVGLGHFADAAAGVERVMNVWLAEAWPANDALFALLEHAAQELGRWVAELAASGRSARDGAALVAAAAVVQQGGAFAMAPAETRVDEQLEALAPPPDDTPAEPAAPAEFAEAAATVAAPDTAGQIAGTGSSAQTIEPEPPEPLVEAAVPAPAPSAAPAGNVIEFPGIGAPRPARDDNLKHIGELDIPLPLFNIYLAETDELVRLLARDFGEWRHEPRRPVSGEALQAAHTLAGTSATVGFMALRELAHALEMTLEALLPPAPHLDPAQHDLLDFTIERIRQMLQSFAQGDMPAAQPELVAALLALRAQLAATAPAASDDIEARLDSLLAETMESITAPPVQPAAPAADEVDATPLDALFRQCFNSISGTIPLEEPAPVVQKPKPVSTADDIDDLFNSAFDDAFDEPALTQIAAPSVPDAEPAPVAQSESEVEAAAEPEAEAEPTPEPESEPEPEPEPEPLAELEAPAEVVTAPPLQTETALSFAATILPLAAASELLAAAPALFHDEIDADLLPVFLEEGADLLPQVGQLLRAWHAAPADAAPAQSLLRILHTLKGSARMAGAMRLGQHAHEIETHIENMVHAGSATPQAFDELLAHYDHAMLLFEQLQQAPADAAPSPADGADGGRATAATVGDPAEPAAAQLHAPDEAPAAKTALVRVRADILDRLVNQAGEVSISRSRLENEVAALRGSLFDFSDNLARLRRQLREVEMQAESQIASRMAVSSEREFDPLEFDRFTRLQELTRMMAESVNDVASFHESLSRSVDSAGEDLVRQARLTRDLQRDLMRVRMVPFASIAERLFRVARQSAKEVDKRVNLDIRGGAVEIDRSVLERMAAPFEHLLRNAIAHGVETRAARAAAGKNETGELLVQVSQQGNEVVIDFSDDGGGLDLARIRAKAASLGLLAAGEEIGDVQAANLIFAPGFSTAEALTELSGRGVGMDVVQSEAQALGGRVDLFSDPGKGARFTIHLPLTLAVAQVVLLGAGGKTYALPSVLVEQVLQLKEAALAEAWRQGHIASHGQHAALHYLPVLLGEGRARPAGQRSSPVLLLKSGSERLALQVDEVLGNREVVIKNVGPQLARMVGIAGATVLGSGDIVLILNPVALAQHLAQHPELQAQYAAAAVDSPALPPAQGKTIMVVDDSLTVRRVTQRLLEREGYQVLLAKDGVDALEQLQGRVPDLMLVDIEMPRMDGFDLTRNVRGDERTAAVPIIMITSRSADKHRNVALALGVNAYFGKPFQEPVLLGTIASLLG